MREHNSNGINYVKKQPKQPGTIKDIHDILSVNKITQIYD
jgi:hypothetical protein